MKRLLLLSLLATGTVGTMFAADPEPSYGPNKTSENLTLEWYGIPTGQAKNSDLARTGIGINGKFYVTVRETGIEIYNKDGQIKMIDHKETWISINCDDAGHVYFRHDDGGWNDPRSCYTEKGKLVPGAYYHSDKTKFSVIDTKTDEIIARDIPMAGLPQSIRFDELPHVVGDMVNDYVEIPVAVQNKWGAEFIYEKLEQVSDNVPTINITSALKEGGFPSPANTITSQAQAQMYNGSENIAVMANPHLNVTYGLNGWGNNLAVFEFDGEDYMFANKWFNLPNHNNCSGFYIFNYDGNNYVIYPSGMFGGYPSADGFFVMPEELLDSPKNKTATEDPEDWSVQLHKPVAFKYATEDYGAAGTYRGLNVEPIEGEDGKFRIYLYCPGKVMEVWQLDLTGSAGVEDIVADINEAKIFGGEGRIIVESESVAQVYSVAGQLIAEGNGSIAVPAGVYIVKADNKAAKIVVK